MPKDRQPYIGEIIPLTSPADAEVTFGIRRLDQAAIMKYRDLDASVRYVYREGDEQYTTEKDYPLGTRRVDTVMLGLASWNITDNGKDVSITRENVLKYMDPSDGELDAIYEKVLEVNPVLTGAAQVKKS